MEPLCNTGEQVTNASTNPSVANTLSKCDLTFTTTKDDTRNCFLKQVGKITPYK